MDKTKKSILLTINGLCIVISFIVFAYTRIIVNNAKNFDKTKNAFNGSIANSQYCKYITSKIDFKLIVILAIIILISYIIMTVIAITKKEKIVLKLVIGFIASIALCILSVLAINNCSGIDDTWGDIEAPTQIQE